MVLGVSESFIPRNAIYHSIAKRFRNLHCSVAGSKIPSPQLGLVQSARQVAEGIASPSSHTSPVVFCTMPSPQKGFLQLTHVAEGIASPSSHSSPAAGLKTPSPQTGMVQLSQVAAMNEERKEKHTVRCDRFNPLDKRKHNCHDTYRALHLLRRRFRLR